MILSRLLTTIAVLSSGLVLMISAVGKAGRFSISSSTFRQTYSTISFEGGLFGTVRCPVTLEGSFHSRTMAKTAESLIGLITRAIVGEAACASGRARFKTETLPWHIRYSSFTGTLPTITAVKRVSFGARINLPIEGRDCFYNAAVPNRYLSIELIKDASGRITQVRFSADVEPEPSNIFPCPPTVRADGQGTETVLGGATGITLTLI